MNAFTAALDIDSSNVLYLSNRAACFLKTEQPSDAFKDCTKALECMTREQELLKEQLIEDTGMEAKRKQRCKILLRRGLAQVSMGHYKGAFEDYKEALAMDPMNQEIQKNLNHLSTLLPVS